MGEVFHIAPLMLGPGSVILPGNWGRLVRAQGERHPCWTREKSLEDVRLRSFPDKPPRLEATYAVPSIQAARLYRDYVTPGSIIYRVAIADPNARIHVGDFNAVDPLPGKNLNRDEVSERYWMGADRTNLVGFEQVPCIEIVCASPLVVINRAE